MYVFQIKRLRKSKDISQYMLAKEAKINRSYLVQLENGTKRNPSLDILYRISKALNVNIKDLFYTFEDIPYLKKKLNIIVSKFGNSSSEAIELNYIIDDLLSLKFKKEIK